MVNASQVYIEQPMHTLHFKVNKMFVNICLLFSSLSNNVKSVIGLSSVITKNACFKSDKQWLF